MDDPAGRGARAQTTSPEGFIQKGTRDKRRMTEEPCEVETLTHGFEAEAGGSDPLVDCNRGARSRHTMLG